MSFTVVCTDRGQHKPVVFTTVELLDDGRRYMSHLEKHVGVPGEENNAGHSGDVYEFVCPRCRRSPQFRRDVWWALVDKILESDVTQFDLSQLRA